LLTQSNTVHTVSKTDLVIDTSWKRNSFKP
jgi:hypothetical protein